MELHTLSPFQVSNRVHQGGVLSPILFTMYIDDLLSGLQQLGVGCHWGSDFVGADVAGSPACMNNRQVTQEGM